MRITKNSKNCIPILNFDSDFQPPVVQKWVVSPEDQAAADKLFLQADMDMDGFVSGAEIKDVFLQSGLPPKNLAHIW